MDGTLHNESFVSEIRKKHIFNASQLDLRITESILETQWE